MIKLTTLQYINNCKKIHGDKYDYSLVEYISPNEKQLKLYDEYKRIHDNSCICFDTGGIELDGGYSLDDIQIILDILKDNELLKFIISNQIDPYEYYNKQFYKDNK